MARAEQRSRRRLTGLVLFGMAVGMVGVSFAAVPLYRVFCQVTGYAGTPKTEGVTASSHVTDQVITVRFDANVNSALPWGFRPLERQVSVQLGEERLIHYEAVNHSARPVVGTATFSVTPYKVAQYFAKMQCFCFTEQRLEPGQSVSMPVVFYIDPAFADDPNVQDVTTVTLSYTFFPADLEAGGDAESVRSGIPAGAAREAMPQDGASPLRAEG